MMLKNPSKFPSVLIPMFLIEFSVILAWFWMTGDFEKIRFGVWPMSEWLINYQGGFVRRGLIGELLFQVGSGQPLIPLLNHLTFYFYLVYCFIFVLLYYFAKIRNNLLLTIALLIPGGIFQMAISASFFTRKEILFLILFGLLCLIFLRINSLREDQRKPWLLTFSMLALVGGIFLTLSHEAYLFMGFPYAATLFWFLKKEYVQFGFLDKAFKCFCILIPLVFILCVFEHGTVLTSEQIWDSVSLADRLTISPHSPYTVYGAIGGIGWGKLQNLSTLYGVFVTGGWVYWLLFIGGNFLVLAYLVRGFALSMSLPEQNRFLTLLSIPLFFSLSMFAIGSDWGRWLASAGNHVILLGFALRPHIGKLPAQISTFHLCPQRFLSPTSLIGSGAFALVIILYELLFKLPECCIEFPQIFIQYSDFVRAILGP